MKESEYFDIEEVKNMILEKYVLLTRFAKAVGDKPNNISLKVNGYHKLTRMDIDKWAKALGIPKRDYGIYFFKEKTYKSE